MKYKTLLLFGAPGSGKGTWGKMLGGMPGFCHVSSGDMFRGLDPDSEIGKLCASYAKRGELVPDDVTVRLWKEHMKKLQESKRFAPEKDHLVLDGLPRNLAQAKMLDEHLDVRGILELDCPDENILVERLRRRALIEGRQDDADEKTIRNRFKVYREVTAQMLAHYPADAVMTIDVSIPILNILHEMSTALVKKLQ